MKTPRLLATVSAALTACSLASAGLILNYTFDSGAAVNVAPGAAIGNANAVNNGTGAGFVANTPSGAGLAYSTGNGVDNYLATTTGHASTLFSNLGSFTLATWINLQAAPATFDRLMSWQAAGNGPGFNLNIVAPSSGTFSATNFDLALTVGGIGGGTATVAGQGTGTWAFIAATFNAGSVSYYRGTVDGSVTLLGSTTLSGVTSTGSSISASFEIAGTSASALDRSPGAFFDDVRIYDTALNLGELEAVRASVVPEPSTAAITAGLAALLAVARRRVRR